MILTNQAETIMEHSYTYVYNISVSPPQEIYAPDDKNTYVKSTPVLPHFRLQLAPEACLPWAVRSVYFPWH